ncbi:hypothetical protein ACSNOK_06685 [Streptomyces sp. URMC 126]|uniref:hypothetical protein n=1 Tax=Streptomyces sp. URMC 126 TaxID=3423401 RepID=UPI003F1B80A9
MPPRDLGGRVLDLDQAAALIAERFPRWRAAGLTPGQPTWRDAAADWPQPLLTERSAVRDPDSLGLVLTGPTDTELSVVLFRGGWADVDFLAGPDDFGTLPTPDALTSATDVATHLDRWVLRVFDRPCRNRDGDTLTAPAAPGPTAEPGTPPTP